MKSFLKKRAEADVFLTRQLFLAKSMPREHHQGQRPVSTKTTAAPDFFRVCPVRGLLKRTKSYYLHI
jgi:hypothetical protein